ncbi:colicin immunity domain-containing protein [Planomicrobium sp. CPCC 101079]|uniref:colicin immunity domain-containing protein n=1 Tax=Planomicrobium sp. CPCC 101079 TaxID=2599618 RepID=UPI0021064737|nr:colicin immunity domain-containing protein [Planomicrobium sp. CPCC 101079]
MEAKYKNLMEKFIKKEISADEFQTLYMDKFIEWNDRMNEYQFEILNGVFEAADCYWHECLPGQETAFEISAQQLREEVVEALNKLNQVIDSQ